MALNVGDIVGLMDGDSWCYIWDNSIELHPSDRGTVVRLDLTAAVRVFWPRLDREVVFSEDRLRLYVAAVAAVPDVAAAVDVPYLYPNEPWRSLSARSSSCWMHSGDPRSKLATVVRSRVWFL